MATDEEQFFQLLDCLMSLDNNIRQQAEVSCLLVAARVVGLNVTPFSLLLTAIYRHHMEQYRSTTNLSTW